MKVGANKKKINYLPFSLIALVLIFIVAKSFLAENSVKPAIKEKKQLAKTNWVEPSISYSDLIDHDESRLASRENLSIHLVEEFDVLQILYIYKGELSERQLNDRFFLHIYLKDPSLLKQKYNFPYSNLNFDFNASRPILLKKEGISYSIFRKELIHQPSKQELLLTEVDFVSTGRFNAKLGRSLTIDTIYFPNQLNTKVNNRPLKKVDISMNKAAFAKIEKKRNVALDNGILVTTDDDLVNAKIINGKEVQKVKLRLKGDWVDHLNHERKWSFRLVLGNGKTAFGMRKLSLQHPKTRHYLWEWLFQKCVKDNDLIGLRYDFIDLNLNVQEDSGSRTIPLGIMALEEFFDKILIENNRRREGLVLAIDESISWDERERQRTLHVEETKTVEAREIYYLQNSPIKVFNKNKVLADEKLKKQFHIAHDLFDGLRKRRYKVSEVFDLDKLTTFIAISNLFGNYHGFALENLRIYYNPITNKLEPIAFDANAGNLLGRIIQYPFSEGDKEYEKMLWEKLALVGNQEFVNNLLHTHQIELEYISRSFETEFDFVFEPSILKYNSNYIQKAIAELEAERILE